MTDPSDKGIVLYLRGPNSADAATSYVDRKGTVRQAGALGTAWTAMSTSIDTAHPHASAAAATSMFVIVTGLDEAETVTVRCRQAYKPDPLPGPAADTHFVGPVYFDTLWVLQKTGGLTDVEFALTADGPYLMQTASDLLGDQLEFSAKSSSASSPASVIIACKVA